MSQSNESNEGPTPWSSAPRFLEMPRSRGPGRFGPKLAIGLAAGTVLVAALCASFYTVQPTEMAGVRRLGTVLTKEPVGPGLHLKAPFIDTVDTIQTSLSTYQLSDLTVYTVDNQPVTVGIGMSYRIPAAAVMKLLYDVGRTGNVDVNETIRPVLADRVLRVFSTQNTVNISANRDQIAAGIRKDVGEALGRIFGLQITDLQLSSITYPASFQASVEAAVQAKNDAIRAENTVVRVRYEGEQAKVQAEAQATARVAQANGEADAAIAQARGQREAAILRAQGDSQAALLVGDAEARVIQQTGSAVSANPSIVAYEQAHRWNGKMPDTLMGPGRQPARAVQRSGADSGPVDSVGGHRAADRPHAAADQRPGSGVAAAEASHRRTRAGAEQPAGHRAGAGIPAAGGQAQRHGQQAGHQNLAHHPSPAMCPTARQRRNTARDFVCVRASIGKGPRPAPCRCRDAGAKPRLPDDVKKVP